MYITIAIAVAITFGLFQLIIPLEESKKIDEALLEKNGKKYALYEGLAIFPLFLFMGTLIYIVYKTGNVLAEKLITDDGHKFFYAANAISWTMPGLILGFGVVGIPLERLYQFILKDEYPLYLEAANRRHGWDARKLMIPLSKVLMLAGSISFVLLLNTSVRVTEDTIFINKFFSFSERAYRLDEVDAIVYYDSKFAPNGDLVDNDQIIFYANGVEVWSTEIAFLNDEPERFDPMIEFVSNRNQLDILEEGTYRY